MPLLMKPEKFQLLTVEVNLRISSQPRSKENEGQAIPPFQTKQSFLILLHRSENFLACQVCTMRKWLCGMISFFFWHKIYYLTELSPTAKHGSREVLQRCFSIQSQEQPAASKSSALSGKDLSSQKQHQCDHASDPVGRVPFKLFNSLENSLHMTHFRYPQVQAVNSFSVSGPFPF